MRHPAFCLALAVFAWTAAAGAPLPHLTRRHLGRDVVIQGYPCARGYAWFYDSGSLNRCFASRSTSFGEAQIPRGSVIQLWPDGATQFAMLAHRATVAGYYVSGGSFLGPAEGAITSFYRSGKLHTAYLVHNQTIQGVPCRGSQWGLFTDSINGGNYIVLYPDGRLRACKLTRDFGGQRAGHRLTLPDANR